VRRREFIAGLGRAVAWPLSARAQQGERVRRVGFLSYGDDADIGPIRKLMHDELERLGWTEGRNLRLDFRFAHGDATQARVLAADLIQLAPDLIVTFYGVAFRSVQQKTKAIPIVFVGGGDPVAGGMVKDIARPEGNATGFAIQFGSLGGKWLELLKEVAPNITRVAHLYLVDLPSGYLPSIETAGRALEVQIVRIPISEAADMKAAIEAFAAEPNGGLLPSPAIPIATTLELIPLAAQYRLPTIYGPRSLPANGGLLSYDSDAAELLPRAASYVDRLPRGAKVSDLAVQYPTKFSLVINLKTAKALGLTVPRRLLALADEVIE